MLKNKKLKKYEDSSNSYDQQFQPAEVIACKVKNSFYKLKNTISANNILKSEVFSIIGKI